MSASLNIFSLKRSCNNGLIEKMLQGNTMDTKLTLSVLSFAVCLTVFFVSTMIDDESLSKQHLQNNDSILEYSSSLFSSLSLPMKSQSRLILGVLLSTCVVLFLLAQPSDRLLKTAKQVNYASLKYKSC